MSEIAMTQGSVVSKSLFKKRSQGNVDFPVQRFVFISNLFQHQSTEQDARGSMAPGHRKIVSAGSPPIASGGDKKRPLIRQGLLHGIQKPAISRDGVHLSQNSGNASRSVENPVNGCSSHGSLSADTVAREFGVVQQMLGATLRTLQSPGYFPSGDRSPRGCSGFPQLHR